MKPQKRPRKGASAKFRLTESLVLRDFDAKTVSKARDYWERGLVTEVKVSDGRLMGRVLGTAARPYGVRVSVVRGRVESDCSCPVGWQCKHGAALCLRWLDAPIEETLETRSDYEMDPESAVHVLRSLMAKHPELEAEADAIWRGSAIACRKASSVKTRFRRALDSDLDYQSVKDVNAELMELVWDWERVSADMGAPVQADVSLSMFESLAEALKRADDSVGMLSSLASRCVDMFVEAAEGLDDLGKDSLRPRALKLYREDMDELGGDILLLHTVTEESAAEVIAEVRKHGGMRLKGRSQWHSSYEAKMVKDLEDAIMLKIGRGKAMSGSRKGTARSRSAALSSGGGR